MSRNDFENVVKQAWRHNAQGSAMYRVVKKIQLLRKKAKIWNKQTFGNIFEQLKVVDNELLEIQSRLSLNSNHRDLARQEVLLK